MIGADHLPRLAGWRSAADLVGLSEVVVMPREGLRPQLPEDADPGRFILVEDFDEPVSSVGDPCYVGRRQRARGRAAGAGGRPHPRARPLRSAAPLTRPGERPVAVSLILVDGSALVYRAHYAFANRPLTAPAAS